jgi:hypothetical protein
MDKEITATIKMTIRSKSDYPNKAEARNYIRSIFEKELLRLGVQDSIDEVVIIEIGEKK